MAKMFASIKSFYYFCTVIQFSKKAEPRKGKRVCPVAITRHALFV